VTARCEIMLEIQHLIVEYQANKGRTVHAVSDIGFQLVRGETLGLVGESGCGKSSVARAIIQLPPPTSGTVLFKGKDLTKVDGKRLRQVRPQLQMIFQDSISALNPRREIGNSIAMPLKIIRKGSPVEQKSTAREMMTTVGLDPETFNRLPFQLSAGQCQRVQIARSLITKPALLICDEPVASLDVSIRAQIINLLERLRTQYKLTMLFISHDMAVVKNVCDRVAVMYLGKLCEIARTQDLYRMPAHPYTRTLINAIPAKPANASMKKTNLRIVELPSPINPPSGCRFHTRCPKVRPLCFRSEPFLQKTENGRMVACHFPL
jgi:peptide/nickel transport system ATP-binding protein